MALALTACNNGGNAGSQAAQAPVEAAPAVTQAAPPAAPAPAAQPQDLPELITTFLEQNFPGVAVARVESETENGSLEYDVTLSDGTEIDFNHNNQWHSVDCKVKAVPEAFVPRAIAAHVKNNLQGQPITKITREPYGYEIEVAGGLDLKFNSNGQFLQMDD